MLGNIYICMYRDRENCTVFVADLPTDVIEDELEALFRDVGSCYARRIMTDLHFRAISSTL